MLTYVSELLAASACESTEFPRERGPGTARKELGSVPHFWVGEEMLWGEVGLSPLLSKEVVATRGSVGDDFELGDVSSVLEAPSDILFRGTALLPISLLTAEVSMVMVGARWRRRGPGEGVCLPSPDLLRSDMAKLEPVSGLRAKA